MANTGVCSKRRNTTRTDLSLLLECLKFQMKCPDLQKQALLTIHSICEKREDNVDLLREMGGVSFVYKLSKSSIIPTDVKETALFTLGTLAEANVYCKNYLCKKETFADLAGLLLKEDIPLTQKSVSVYLLTVLVANNKLGQTLGQATGCLDILLDLLRTTSPLSTEATVRAANATQTYQFWASVCSALCGFVNNPQNDEAQRVCVAAFATIKVWLQQIAVPRTEIFQPICSFIAMTVANNSCVQGSFYGSGCLDTLALALVRLASAADTSSTSCQLAVTISKTLSASITENTSLASGLSRYGVVPHLFSLLDSPHLEPEDRLSVLLTLGRCTEASEEHQSQLLRCGGLPVIITLLTEDTSEEVRKAATFILQTCKQATMSSEVPGLTVSHEEAEDVNMEGFRATARELLCRIELLEKKQAMAAEAQQEDKEPLTSSESLGRPLLPPQQRETIKTIHTACRQADTRKHVEAGSDGNMTHISSHLKGRKEKDKTGGGSVWYSVCNGTGSLMPSHQKSLEGDPEPRTADHKLFKPPASVRHSVPKEIQGSDDKELKDCQRGTVGKIRVEENSLSCVRCAVCVLPFEEVTSRTFASLQSSCQHSCDIHQVLREATERFRTRHCNMLLRREYHDDGEPANQKYERVSAAQPRRSWEDWSEVRPTLVRKGAGKGRSSPPWKKHKDIRLTPLHKGATKETWTTYGTGPGLIPLKRSHLPEERRVGNKSGRPTMDDEPRTSPDHGSNRRKRADFSSEEVRYLQRGVKRFGFSWNSILWSYPFHPGRTNVDLAKKYSRLMRGNV
uniref:Telomere repeat binding bouquet formation protein 1 n=1 Tax=Gasterosteus aculeatus aculeatus TaxID=481459 RepID=A0AAQ4R401_GASAC|nr:telomere repeats-binding bouquet formation protein 1-like isoform X2 [Gasterosteus aculeatus aculeatus]